MKVLTKTPIAALVLQKAHQLIIRLLLICGMMSVNAFAKDPVTNFELAPKQCIALHHGQTCFVDIEINWNSTQSDDLCLFSTQQQEPLMCWQQSKQGRYVNEIESSENVTFYLKKMANTQQILATAQLEMAWVYKKNVRSRASWRMF